MNNLTLSSFSKPGVPSDARLHIAKENTNKAYIAPEKFASKVLTWLGKVPLFKNIDAVQKHAENTKVQNQKILQVFIKALAEKYDEKSVNAVVLMAELNDSVRPLTANRVEQITQMVKDAEESFSKDMLSKQNNSLPRAFSLVVKGGEAKGGVTKGEEVKATALPADFRAEMKQNLIDIALKGLMRATPQLEKVDGYSLRENFPSMASGNGLLRTLMTNLQNLTLVPEAKPLNEYVTTLKNIQVGEARFSQWGTNGGEVGKWIDKASDEELTQAARKIHLIAKELKNVTNELQKMKAGAPAPQALSGPTLDLARFSASSVPVNQYTQVKLHDGTPVPVNTLSFDGKAVALAGSYPKTTTAALEAHVKMLFEKECSCLVVLTPEEQMQASKLPAYFRGNHAIGEIRTRSQKMDSANPHIDQYKMQITWGEKQYSLPVMHVKNWPDHQPLPSVAQLEYLAYSVKSMANQNAATDSGPSDKCLPMIHCLGGVGRTGTLAAALVLTDAPHSDLEQVRADFRDSRNKRMMEDSSQFVQLKTMQEHLLTNTVN